MVVCYYNSGYFISILPQIKYRKLRIKNSNLTNARGHLVHIYSFFYKQVSCDSVIYSRRLWDMFLEAGYLWESDFVERFNLQCLYKDHEPYFWDCASFLGGVTLIWKYDWRRKIFSDQLVDLICTNNICQNETRPSMREFRQQNLVFYYKILPNLCLICECS